MHYNDINNLNDEKFQDLDVALIRCKNMRYLDLSVNDLNDTKFQVLLNIYNNKEIPLDPV